jgi:hypothetical protein
MEGPDEAIKTWMGATPQERNQVHAQLLEQVQPQQCDIPRTDLPLSQRPKQKARAPSGTREFTF